MFFNQPLDLFRTFESTGIGVVSVRVLCETSNPKPYRPYMPINSKPLDAKPFIPKPNSERLLWHLLLSDQHLELMV